MKETIILPYSTSTANVFKNNNQIKVSQSGAEYLSFSLSFSKKLKDGAYQRVGSYKAIAFNDCAKKIFQLKDGSYIKFIWELVGNIEEKEIYDENNNPVFYEDGKQKKKLVYSSFKFKVNDFEEVKKKSDTDDSFSLPARPFSEQIASYSLANFKAMDNSDKPLEKIDDDIPF